MWLFLWLAVQLGSTEPSVSGLAMGQSQFPSLVVENPDAYAQQHSLEIDEGKKDQNYMSKPTITMVQMGDLKSFFQKLLDQGDKTSTKIQ